MIPLPMLAVGPSTPSIPPVIVQPYTLKNDTGGTLPARPIMFGLVFPIGFVPAGSVLGLKLPSGTVLSAQTDWKRTHPDGSARHVFMTVQQPSMVAGQALVCSIVKGAAPFPGANISLGSLPGTLVADINVSGIGAFHLDIMTAARGSTDFWRHGPLVTEGRVALPVTGCMRVIADVSFYLGGLVTADVQFCNDRAPIDFAGSGPPNEPIPPNAGPLIYDASVTFNGTVVKSITALRNELYRCWHYDKIGGGRLGGVSIQPDRANLVAAKAIHNFKFSDGISATTWNDNYAAVVAAPGYGGVFTESPAAGLQDNVFKNMGTTGGRADIGLMPRPYLQWLFSSFDRRYFDLMIDWSDVAGSVPWNFWSAVHQRWLTITDYPLLWTDYRSIGQGTPGLAIESDPTHGANPTSGWIPDTAHQPDLSYFPYLLTGSRWCYDRMMAQASYAVTNTYNGGRDNNPAGITGVLFYLNQIRGGAWSLRQSLDADFLALDGSFEKTEYAGIVDRNFQWFHDWAVPTYTASEGAPYGYVPDGFGNNAIAVYMFDYALSQLWMGYRRRNNTNSFSALTFFGHMRAAGMMPQTGWSRNNGANFLWPVSNDGNVTQFQNWSDIDAELTVMGINFGGGWGDPSGWGDYQQLALMSLAQLQDYGITDAAAARTYLLGAGAPFTDLASYQADPSFNVMPL